MAKDTRTLTLKILADVDKLNKQLNQGEKDVSGFSANIEKFGKMAAAAFAAAGAAALAYTKKAVENAIADEASQRRLIETIKSSTNATAEQIRKVEQYIDITSLAIGVTDDELRPALSRLIRSTNDTAKATELLNLALDISAATGKPLEAIANALGKAYDGNANALGRLGLGIDQSILKTKNFDLIYKNLARTFGSFAENEAQSTEKQILRLRIAYDEFQESVGYRVLPILTKFLDIITNQIIPALQKLPEFFKPVLDAIERNKESFRAFGELIQTYVLPIIGVAFVGALNVVAKVAAGVIDVIGKVAGAITTVVNGAITGINALIKAYNAIPILPNIPTIGNISAPKIAIPSVKVSSSGTGGSSVSSFGGSSTAISGTNNKGGVNVKEVPPTLIEQVTAANVMKQAGAGVFNLGRFRAGEEADRPTINNTINIGVAGDPEGAARAIVDVLNSSYTRGTGGASALYA